MNLPLKTYVRVPRVLAVIVEEGKEWGGGGSLDDLLHQALAHTQCLFTPGRRVASLILKRIPPVRLPNNDFSGSVGISDFSVR